MRGGSAASSSGHPAEETLVSKCEQVLEHMSTLDISLGEFVVAVCYGEPRLRMVSLAINAWTSLYSTNCLQRLLELSYEPPRPPSAGGARPVGGSKTIRKFIFETAPKVFCDELADFSEDYELDNKQLANMDYISTITATALHRKIELKCPELYAILSALTVSRPLENEQEPDPESEDEDEDAPIALGPKPAIEPHPHFDIVFQVTSMAYRLHPHRNVLQKVLTIYAHAKHTGKAVLDLLQQAGITMSYSWVRKQMGDLSDAIGKETILAAHTRPIVLVHDNLKLKQAVVSQQGNNQAVSDNGTASTVIILPDDGRVFEDPDNFVPLRRALKAKRIAGTAPELCYQDLDNPARHIANRTAFVFDILDIFAIVPEFQGHKIWDSDKLKRPIGPQQLPHGPEHRLKQYMLPMVNIDETSYSGNSQVIASVLKYLKLDTGSERDRLVLERLIVWTGDQMTAHRCNMLQLFRQESINGYERLDPFIFPFALLHCEMALGQSILELFRGSNVGESFGADIIVLDRSGLQKPSGSKTKRLDFHTVDEFLQHECEAHFRGLFDEMTGCKTLEAREEWIGTHTAKDMLEVASKALREHASSGALDISESSDEFRAVIIKRQRDLLLYCSLRQAIKYGDIDRIEAILPELMYFFIGAGNSNYAREVHRLLQILTHETTPVIREAILRYGLLVNKLGRADSFYPIDQRQELNNKDIRDYAPPPQNSSWEQYAKISPVIPLLSDYVTHVEERITGIRRSHMHKSVKREQDIQVLINRHRDHHLHDGVPGRTIKTADRAKDAMKIGLLAVRDGNALPKYSHKRRVFTRNSSTLQQDLDIPSPPLLPQFFDMQPNASEADLGSPESIHSSLPLDVEDEFSLDADSGLGGLATQMAGMVLEDTAG
ncbi:hypothetical protein RhiJN_00205 [Ceratobasidium sp. AG-Ba]|nr:hypothetical protein RhiJN_00205 [Ceratobasidium sp. AG-Ba]QRW01237.1 hypothetical protein RhiLY_00234 [Ceratobasidium sp. AG-Ba]